MITAKHEYKTRSPTHPDPDPAGSGSLADPARLRACPPDADRARRAAAPPSTAEATASAMPSLADTATPTATPATAAGATPATAAGATPTETPLPTLELPTPAPQEPEHLFWTGAPTYPANSEPALVWRLTYDTEIWALTTDDLSGLPVLGHRSVHLAAWSLGRVAGCRRTTTWIMIFGPSVCFSTRWRPYSRVTFRSSSPTPGATGVF